MPDLGKAYVQIIPSASGIKGQIKSAMSGDANSAATKIGSGMGSKMVSAIKAAIAAAGISKVIGDAFNASAELQQNVGGIEKIYGDAAKTVATNAQNAFKTAQVSANQYMSLATTFGASLLKSTGDDQQKAAAQTEKAIRQISDNYNTFGGDIENLKQAYNNFARGQFTMLDNLKLGYSGSKEGMQQLLADAEKISGVKYDINNFSDIVDAIDVVQEHLNIAGTSANEAGSTIEGSMNMLKSSWANVMSTIGMAGKKETEDMGFMWQTALTNLVESMGTFAENAIPALEGIFGALPSVLTQALVTGLPMLVEGGFKIITALLNGIVESLPILAQSGPKMLTDIMTSIVNGLPLLLSSAAQIVFQLAEGIQTQLPQITATAADMCVKLVQGLTENATLLLNAGLDLIMSLVMGLTDAIPELVAAVPVIVDTLLQFFIENAVTLVKAGLQIILAVTEGIIEALPVIIDALPLIFERSADTFNSFDWSGIGQSIISIITEGIHRLFPMIPNILGNIAENGLQLIASVDWVGLGSSVIRFIVDGISMLFDNIPDILKTIGSTAKDIFTDIDWWGIGKDIIYGIVNGVSNMAGVLFDALIDLANSALDCVLRVLGIGSPSKVFQKEVGQWIPAGVAVGVEGNLDPVKTAMEDLSEVTTATYAAEVSANAKVSPTSATGETTNYGGVAINVYGAEGQDVRQLADEIEKILVNKTLRSEAVFA